MLVNQFFYIIFALCITTLPWCHIKIKHDGCNLIQLFCFLGTSLSPPDQVSSLPTSPTSSVPGLAGQHHPATQMTGQICQHSLLSATECLTKELYYQKNDALDGSMFCFRYTTRLSILFCGEVTHDPWPVQGVQELELDENLSAAGIGQQVSSTPDHICYSDGVGPVHFQFLKPC